MGELKVQNHGATATMAGAPGLGGAEPSADPFFSGRKHFLELDGLRGLAILLVLLCHYFYWLIEPATNIYRKVALAFLGKAGDWGVTLFFVLSGFLITGILYDSKGQDRYFRNFYARRFLRIFPLYYGFLAVMFLVLAAIRVGAPQFYSHSRTPQLLWSYQPWLWTYTANIWMFFHSGMVVIGHFRSLCVEEQFYLVWPLVIFMAPGKKWTARACWVTISIAVVAGVGVQLAGYDGGWLFTPVRMDALAAGGLIALLLRDPGWHRWLSRLGPQFPRGRRGPVDCERRIAESPAAHFTCGPVIKGDPPGSRLQSHPQFPHGRGCVYLRFFAAIGAVSGDIARAARKVLPNGLAALAGTIQLWNLCVPLPNLGVLCNVPPIARAVHEVLRKPAAGVPSGRG